MHSSLPRDPTDLLSGYAFVVPVNQSVLQKLLLCYPRLELVPRYEEVVLPLDLKRTHGPDAWG
jgi:hypothetical protein